MRIEDKTPVLHIFFGFKLLAAYQQLIVELLHVVKMGISVTLVLFLLFEQYVYLFSLYLYPLLFRCFSSQTEVFHAVVYLGNATHPKKNFYVGFISIASISCFCYLEVMYRSMQLKKESPKVNF